MNRLPAFDLDDYEDLLVALISSGYTFRRVSEIGGVFDGLHVFLRHDVDLHIRSIQHFAAIEATHGIQATYYIPLTLHFNPLYPENQYILTQIRDLGHEIGLHYDMETFPSDPEHARGYLDWQARILGEVTGEPIRTICMHQPHKNQPDPFREIDDYIHPHDPRHQEGLLYISDSCRAWRNNDLLTCFSPNPPHRLLLLTHPELWLNGGVDHRMEYLEQVLMKNGVRQHREYFDRAVRHIWMNHPAPKVHDQRERDRASLR